MRRNLAVLVALALCAARPAIAQQPGDSARGEQAAGNAQARDTFRLKELVVTATRTPMARSALPLATTVVTGQELQDRGVRTLAEALRVLPGIAVVAPGSEGGVTSLFLRGGNSGYVKVLVDGVPLNNPGGIIDLSNLTVENVERIEVVRGPGSVLYGSDAVTGVVQVFTRRGAGPARADAAFSGGRGERVKSGAAPSASPVMSGGYGLTDWSADASGGGRRAGWSAGASRFASDGLYPFNNQYLNTTISARADIRPDERSDAAFTLRRSGGDYHYPTDGGGNLVDRNASTQTQSWVLGLEGGRRFGALEARVQLGSNQVRRADLDPPDTVGANTSTGHSRDTRRSADAHLDWHGPAATVLTAGAALEREHEDSRSFAHYSFGDSRDSADVNRTDRGYYAQLLTSPLTALSATAGIRLDDNSRFGRFTTYRTGLAYRLPTGTRLRLAAGTAFKEPTFYENFAHSAYLVGNPDLQPERSTSRELGLSQPLAGGRLVLEATWFDQRFRDLIQYTAQVAHAGDPNYMNLGAARADGLELSLGSAALSTLRVDAAYTYLRTRVITEGAGGDPTFEAGKPLIRRPAHSGSLTAAWHPRVATVSATLAYVGRRDDLDFSDPNAWPAPRLVLPAYARLDLAGDLPVLRARAGRASLDLTVRLDNALNRKYRDEANFPARGRTVFLGARAVI